MKPADYITSQLQHSTDYSMSEVDRTLLASTGVENFIYLKLTSKKFRKWALNAGAEDHTRRALSLSVKQNLPIKCVYPFGGYKLWRIPSSPEVDWAEFFALSYYIKYLAPIAAAYEPGVILTFSSDDAILERINNIPTPNTEAYAQGFKKLLEAFQAFLPNNFKIELARTGDLYAGEYELERELAANVPNALQYYSALSEVEKRKIYEAAEFNIHWKGLKDLTGLSDAKKRSVVETALVYHGAYCQLKKRLDFNRGEDKIIISPDVAVNAIPIGTTKNGVTKFSTGMGILKSVGSDTFRSHILSPTRIDELDSLRLKCTQIDLFDLKNLKEVIAL